MENIGVFYIILLPTSEDENANSQKAKSLSDTLLISANPESIPTHHPNIMNNLIYLPISVYSK